MTWEPTGGRWTAIVMNADGSPGVAADVNVGARAGVLVPLALLLIGLGVVFTATAVTLIIVGASGRRDEQSSIAEADAPTDHGPSAPVSAPWAAPTSPPLPPPQLEGASTASPEDEVAH